MNMNNRKRFERIILVLGCGFLVVVSLITFREQIPTISSTKIYDKEYINVLRKIGHLIPQNETLTTTANYPQVAYFTDHKVKVPWMADSEKSLVQFMWKINSSYLIISEDPPTIKPDYAPLLIQIVEKPFEKVFDYYYNYISKVKPDNPTIQPYYSYGGGSKQKPFEKLFEKIIDYNTEEGSILHLYRLRSNITNDNLSSIVIDSRRPILFVSFPVNGTNLEPKSDVLHLNITGTAKDAETKIKKVEISVNGSVFHLAKPRAPDDWSTWSFSYIITSEGSNKIVARATDNADNKRWFPVYLTIR